MKKLLVGGLVLLWALTCAFGCGGGEKAEPQTETQMEPAPEQTAPPAAESVAVATMATPDSAVTDTGALGE